LKSVRGIGFIVLLVVLVFPVLHNNWLVEGQGQFLRYENPDYDIALQYPSDWIASEENLAQYQVVRFSAPEVEQQETSLSAIIFTPAEITVAVIPVSPQQSTIIEQFSNKLMQDIYPSSQEYRIINSSKTTFAGSNQAQNILMYEYTPERSSKVMRTIAILNDTAYMIKYSAEPGLFDDYLPAAQEMIDSFKPTIQSASNIQQMQDRRSEVASLNDTQVNQGIAELTPPSERTDAPQQKPPTNDVILQAGPSNRNNTLELPKSLTITDSILGDSKLPLRSSIFSGNATELLSAESRRGQLYDWYPIVTFHFTDPSAVGLVNLKHVLTGPIRSYSSTEDVLQEANYWKNIPLNEQIVLEVNQPGLSYLIAAVQFTNGMSGIYSAVMDVDATNTKSAAEDYIDFQMGEGEDLNIVDDSNIEDIGSDLPFQKVASDIICSDLNNYGFQVCSQNGLGTTTPLEQQPSSSFVTDDISSLFEDNDNEVEGNGDNDDEEDDSYYSLYRR